MTKDILDEARAMLEGVPDGPWVYGSHEMRPNWKVVYLPPRAQETSFLATLAFWRFTFEEQEAHEEAGTDPCRELGEFLAWSRTCVPALIERVAAMERDVGILIANIRCLEDAFGETLEGEDAEMVREIEREHDARAILAKGGSDAAHDQG